MEPWTLFTEQYSIICKLYSEILEVIKFGWRFVPWFKLHHPKEFRINGCWHDSTDLRSIHFSRKIWLIQKKLNHISQKTDMIFCYFHDAEFISQCASIQILCADFRSTCMQRYYFLGAINIKLSINTSRERTKNSLNFFVDYFSNSKNILAFFCDSHFFNKAISRIAILIGINL